MDVIHQARHILDLASNFWQVTGDLMIEISVLNRLLPVSFDFMQHLISAGVRDLFEI